MSRNKIVFISDSHLGGGKDFDWLEARGRRELTTFLTGLASDGSLAELILVGDTMDCWVWPHLDQAPPTYAEILAAGDNQGVVAALRVVCAIPGVMVTYIQGNHDMDSWQDLPGTLSGNFPGIHYEPVGIDRGPLWAEHGSLHTIFNAPDPLHDPQNGLPLGYFITRVNESKVDKARKNYTIGAVVREAVASHLGKQVGIIGTVVEPAGLRAATSHQIEAMQRNFISEKLAAVVFEFVVAKVGRTLADNISLPGGASVTLKSVRDRYADLYADKVTELGDKGAWDALIAEIDQMEPVAEAEGKKRHKKAVLFGHSHRPHIAAGVHTYLNDGCFLRDTRGLFPKYPHFVEAVPTNGGYNITIWRRGKDGSTEKSGSVKI
jgi:UDP-2,3-diacylglucosamine pyrophosphatase LpxH